MPPPVLLPSAEPPAPGPSLLHTDYCLISDGWSVSRQPYDSPYDSPYHGILGLDHAPRSRIHLGEALLQPRPVQLHLRGASLPPRKPPSAARADRLVSRVILQGLPGVARLL